MRSWYHTLEFPDGTVTPGYYDTRTAPSSVPWPGPLTGSRCLDVGTFDGFWAFEMEKRGAREVVAVDVDDPEELDWPYDNRRRGPEEVRRWRSERGPGFVEASRALGSKAIRINRSVYDLDPATEGTFDVVLCGALLQHLRDPVRALEAMRTVCSGCLLLVEGIDQALEVRARRVPAARFMLDFDQWWRVNSRGLVALARRAGFRVEQVGPRFLVPFGEGAHGRKAALLSSIAARRPFERGVLHRALRAVPRPPADAAD